MIKLYGEYVKLKGAKKRKAMKEMFHLSSKYLFLRSRLDKCDT